LKEGFSPEVAEEWLAEIERRIAAYDRGEVEAIPAEEVINWIRAQLEESRRRQHQSETESG
jgi:putative addiction module component (TIGR02574 family)